MNRAQGSHIFFETGGFYGQQVQHFTSVTFCIKFKIIEKGKKTLLITLFRSVTCSVYVVDVKKPRNSLHYFTVFQADRNRTE